MYRYGLIGNCQISALISEKGAINWLCFPRPDSEPVFGKLLDEKGGNFSIHFADVEAKRNVQYYIENTNILVTEVHHADGSGFRITDFCPRFEQQGRMFRPLTLVRILEPIQGTPLIKVHCDPVKGWTKEVPLCALESGHLRFEMNQDSLRIATNMPLTHLQGKTPFALSEKIYFTVTWDTPFQGDLTETCERYLLMTQDYWRTWVKHCSVPVLFQNEVIRSALTLKLHVFEDTGAILAALTTSLPEEHGQNRNWDYRFCWLRDAYFALSAFHNLGHFEEMEGFLRFLLNVGIRHEDSGCRLAPVYTLNQALPLPEVIRESWKGFAGSGPVRTNNQAAEHIQNDVYGELILALAPIFFDQRFKHLRTSDLQQLMTFLGRRCAMSISEPDAGLWEIRNGWQEHTFSNLMCWAGLERLERIQKLGYCLDLSLDSAQERERAESAVRRAIKDGYLRNGPLDSTLDASLALLPILHFPDQDLAVRTIDRIQSELKADETGAFFHRYVRPDDFGTPNSAFLICSFWMAQSLAMLGQVEKARDLLQKITFAGNHVGLYAEHFFVKKNLQLGNFPQAYSHIGLINAAFAVSPPWHQIL